MDFFLYLGSIVALYSASIAFLNLLFDAVNAYFPDILDFGFDPFSSSLRLSMATLVMLFPVYLILTGFLNKEIKAHPEKINLSIRKWLIYLTLFISSVVVLTDFVVLINTYLGGEITLRFVFKVLSVLIVSTLIFGYYFYDLKDKWMEKKGGLKILTVAVSLFVLVAIVFAFVIIGSPKTQRLKRIDSQKTGDLQNIQQQIINYWQQKEKLPKNLDELNDPISSFSVPKDPEQVKDKSYSYEVNGTLSFSLCALFNLSSSNSSTMPVYPNNYPIKIGNNQNDNWFHEAGKTCFVRTIDPEFHPPIKR